MSTQAIGAMPAARPDTSRIVLSGIIARNVCAVSYIACFLVGCAYYNYLIVPNYSYALLGGSFSVTAAIYAVIILYFTVQFTAPTFDSSREIILHVLYCAFYLPFCIYFVFNPADIVYFLYCSLAVVFIIAASTVNIRLPDLPSVAPGIFTWYTIGLLAIIYLLIVYSGGVSIFNLDYKLVYLFRGESKEIYSGYFLPYLIPWAGRIFIPSLTLIGLIFKKKWLIVLSVALSVLLFAFSSHKSHALFPAFILAMYFILTRFRYAKVLPLALMGLFIASAIEYFVFSSDVLNAVIIRRALFVPASIAFSYYDLFSDIGFVHLTNSSLGVWGDYPFAYPPAELVSLHRTGLPYSHANIGLFGSGYMQFGLAGLLVYAAITGLLIALVRMLAAGLAPAIAAGFVILPFRTLFVDSDLPTVLLTHGLGVAIGYLALFPRLAAPPARPPRSATP